MNTESPAHREVSPISNKHKYAVYAYPETMDAVDARLGQANCSSRSEFIEKAVSFFTGYLSGAERNAYLPVAVTAAIEGVVAIPHLGASTPESEDNCAMMAAREVKEYLDNGSIINSVNLPNLTMAWAAKTRVCVISKGADAAAIAGAVPAVASASNTRGEYAYTILDTDAAVDEAAIAAIPGVLRVRVLTR